MNLSQKIGHYVQIAIVVFGGWLVAHGVGSADVAAQIAQLCVGAALMLGASGIHVLRLWVDKRFPGIAGFVDVLDTAAGELQPLQTPSTSVTTTVSSTKSLTGI